MSYKAWYNQDADYNTNARSYMDYLARHNKFMKVLVEDYEVFKEIMVEDFKQFQLDTDETIESFQSRLDNIQQEMTDLFIAWLEDGTLETIINENIFNGKADKEQIDLLYEKLLLKADKEETDLINDKLTLKADKVETDLINDKLALKADHVDLVETNANVEKLDTTLSGFSNDPNYTSTIETADQIRTNLKNQNRIRIATFNYKMGGGGIETPNNILLEAFKTMEKSGASIVGIQEQGLSGYYNLDKYKSVTFPYAHFYESFIPETVPPRSYGNLTLSEYPMLAKGGGAIVDNFPELEPRSYNRTVYTIQGKNIAVYNTHLAHNSVETRAEQIAFLFNVVQNDDVTYKIILGDFNTRFASHWQQFLNAGYTHHNNNEFPTFKASGEGIDGVITSPGLTGVNKNIIVTDDNVSDHNLFYVDIQL